MNLTQLNQTFLHPNGSFSFLLFINVTTIFFSCIAILSSLIFMSIIVSNRASRTLANILSFNSTVAILFISSDTLSIAIHVLYRDLNQRQLQVSIEMTNLFLCHLRGYIAHISFCAIIYSYVIQALYRLVSTIFYYRISLQQLKIYKYAICIQWTLAVLQILPIGLGNNQIFLEHEYLCQIAIENSKAIGYICLTNYLIPLAIIMIMYYMIAKFVRQREKNGTSGYNIHRARRQLVLTQRILILIAILLVLGGPYSTFILLEVFSIRRAPTYAHRIGFMFISIAAALSIITIIRFTRPAFEMITKFLTIKKRWQMRDELQHLNRMADIELSPKGTSKITDEDT